MFIIIVSIGFSFIIIVCLAITIAVFREFLTTRQKMNLVGVGVVAIGV